MKKSRSTKRYARNATQTKPEKSFSFEELENRQLLAVDAFLQDGVLHVVGDDSANTVIIRTDPATNETVVTERVRVIPKVEIELARGVIPKVEIELRGGDDSLGMCCYKIPNFQLHADLGDGFDEVVLMERSSDREQDLAVIRDNAGLANVESLRFGDVLTGPHGDAAEAFLRYLKFDGLDVRCRPNR